MTRCTPGSRVETGDCVAVGVRQLADDRAPRGGPLDQRHEGRAGIVSVTEVGRERRVRNVGEQRDLSPVGTEKRPVLGLEQFVAQVHCGHPDLIGYGSITSPRPGNGGGGRHSVDNSHPIVPNGGECPNRWRSGPLCTGAADDAGFPHEPRRPAGKAGGGASLPQGTSSKRYSRKSRRPSCNRLRCPLKRSRQCSTSMVS